MRSLVSVIIPCYNQGRYLSEAIESVQSQTYPHCEIIVVDDGSTDNTREVAARYSAVRYIYQKNQGVAASRNRGCRESKGEFVIFLDADDKLLRRAVEANLLCMQGPLEYGMVFGQCRLISSGGAPLAGDKQKRLEKVDYLELLRQNHINCPGMVLFRRSAFDKVGGFVSNNLVEDYNLYLRIARNYPIACHHEVITEYRMHGANTSSNYQSMIDATVAELRAHLPDVKGDKVYEEACRAGMRRHRIYYGEQLFWSAVASARSREWQPAIHKTFVLLRYSPSILVKNLMLKLQGSGAALVSRGKDG